MEFEMNETIGIIFKSKELNDVESWLYNFYEKEFINKKIYEFLIKNRQNVEMSGGFCGFSKMTMSNLDVSMYNASIYFNNNLVIELDEDETILETITTVKWNDEFINENQLFD